MDIMGEMASTNEVSKKEVIMLIFCYYLISLVFQKAKKKPMAKYTPADFEVDISPRLKIISVEDPPVREAGSKVENVDELIEKLKGAGVI